MLKYISGCKALQSRWANDIYTDRKKTTSIQYKSIKRNFCSPATQLSFELRGRIYAEVRFAII